MVVLADQSDIVLADAIHGAPHLFVEVLSPSHPERDRIVKRALYARSGINEFWIVDPEAKAVEVFTLGGSGYEPAGWFTGGDTLVSPSLHGLEISLEAIFTSPCA